LAAAPLPPTALLSSFWVPVLVLQDPSVSKEPNLAEDKGGLMQLEWRCGGDKMYYRILGQDGNHYFYCIRTLQPQTSCPLPTVT